MAILLQTLLLEESSIGDVAIEISEALDLEEPHSAKNAEPSVVGANGPGARAVDLIVGKVEGTAIVDEAVTIPASGWMGSGTKSFLKQEVGPARI
ncbi:hypothetical protein Nepgr_010108 [Nepenthes gracilis]|uniref:Uncharacterized protein n=1 Tax=Nepenthes gracilis TaxID=150966 RepID=A0AAD3SBM2_NEPGR|nr:hypothetical protein Nepgr_010108 [Nepenthes gracilis]